MVLMLGYTYLLLIQYVWERGRGGRYSSAQTSSFFYKYDLPMSVYLLLVYRDGWGPRVGKFGRTNSAEYFGYKE